MVNIGIWQIENDTPQRLERGSVEFEKHLEEWIERDPTILQSGLTVVGRQINVDAGKLDLLALDPIGNWVVIEVKRGNVRRETIAQAIDYAACITDMPFRKLATKVNTYLKPRGTSLQSLLEERGAEDSVSDAMREVTIYVVGTGRDPGLERIVNFLASSGQQINVVNYTVFTSENGQQVIVRELTELDAHAESAVPTTDAAKTQEISVVSLCSLADENGIGREFRMLLEAAQRHGFYPRTYKWSIMYTPPANRTRMLFTVRVKPTKEGHTQVYIGPEAFAEFYPISESEAINNLGTNGWYALPSVEVKRFVQDLDRLFTIIDRDR